MAILGINALQKIVTSVKFTLYGMTEHYLYDE